MLMNTEFSTWKSIPARFQRNKMIKLRERETGSSMSDHQTGYSQNCHHFEVVLTSLRILCHKY